MRRVLALSLLAAVTLCGQQKPTHWIATWACAPQLTERANMPPAPGLSGNTLRQSLRTTIAGKRLRMHFSNIFGDAPLTMKEVRLTGRTLLFSGSPSVTIPKGETVTSDPFDYDLPPQSDLTLTIWFGDVPAALTGHPGSRTTSYLQNGNAVAEAAPDLSGAAKMAHWYVITALDVLADAKSAEVIVLGDSITDGRGSTTDGNDRWTDDLARRLLANPPTASLAVLNEGLGGNTVLGGGNGPPAIARFDRDVLAQNAPRWLIVLEGVNDIGTSHSPSVAADLIAAFGRFIDKAHARGIRVYGCPILPFGKSFYDSPAHEAARETVNQWIRTSGKFDAVIDLSAAVSDPQTPANLLPQYDTGDHLHPNAAGYHRIADSIDLALFKN